MKKYDWIDSWKVVVKVREKGRIGSRQWLGKGGYGDYQDV